MILERRQILFDLVGVHKLLYQAFNTNPLFEKIIPLSFSSYQILGALHTRHFSDVPEELRVLMMSLIDEMPAAGVIFRIGKKNAARYDKEIGFVVPENLMLEVLVDECLKQKIMIPKNTIKTCLSKEMYVGFEFSLRTQESGDFQLE
jgi:hypothetical protein